MAMLALLCAAAAAAPPLSVGGSAVAPAGPPFNSTWLRSSSSKVNLTLNGTSTLRWTEPKHFSAIFSYLPTALPLTKVGAVANVSMRWRSSGDNVCPASCYAGKNYCQSKSCQAAKCVSKSVNCLGGTGDFRIALLDTSHSSDAVKGDNWCPAGVGYKDMTKCVSSGPFPEMRGYDFRIFPHLTADAKHEPGQVPCSIYRKSSPNLFGKSPRLGEWGCFGTPLGEWTTLSLVIKHETKDEWKLSMTMNGVTREAKVSIKVIHFPLKMMNIVLKMMNIVLQMMNFVFKIMNFAGQAQVIGQDCDHSIFCKQMIYHLFFNDLPFIL